jgi:hypothetical protein
MMLLVKKSTKDMYRFALQMARPFKTNQTVMIYGVCETNSPINLKDYKEFITNVTGLTYSEDYLLYYQNKLIVDDNFIVAGDQPLKESLRIEYPRGL